MAAILTPGYVRWDGTKYVLDEDVEIVGPEGSAGPTGPTGPAGTPGIGVGATASGDLSGTFPTPITVVGLTGTSGVVSFGSSIATPTIGQTTAGSTSGFPITLRGQAATANGGNVVLQSGTGTTPGLIQFLVGNTVSGYFDSAGALRLSSSATSSINWMSVTLPAANTTSLYSYTSSVNNQMVLANASATGQSVFDIINTSGTPSGGRVIASGPSDAISAWASNLVVEQIGTGTSAIVFSKASNAGSGRSTTARLYQTGALAIGDSATTNSSAAAQAGLTGPVLSISSSTGTLTTATNQSTLSNNLGTLSVQANTAISLVSGVTLVAQANASKFVTSLGRRVKVTNTTTSYAVLATDEVISVGTTASAPTITLPASPTTGDTYVIKDANGNAAARNINISGGANLIDVSTTYVISANYGVATVVFNGTKWITV